MFTKIFHSKANPSKLTVPKALRGKVFSHSLFLLSSSLFLPPVHGKGQTLLKCLGREESALHKAKSDGAAYSINQKLISQLITMGDFPLKPQYLQKICNSKDFSPSVKISSNGPSRRA